MSTGLENLNDIMLPEPVSFWPPAEGWIVLLLIGLSFLIPWFIRAWRRYQADSYRREALCEAEHISRVDDPQLRLIRLLDLLKRTALTVYPREEAAALSGDSWWAFLFNKTLSGQAASNIARAGFSPAFSQQLNELLYYPAASGNISKQDSDLFLRKVKVWIKQHKRIEDANV